MVIYFISDSTCNAAAALLGWRLAEDGAVVGVVVLQFNDDHRFVEAQARRRGRDETRLHLHLTMTRGIALYRRLGYTEYARREVDGYYRVYLCKRLREGGARR